jgi:hypothetical protein
MSKLSSDFFFHVLSGWLMDFENPVIFHAAKNRSTTALSRHAPITHAGSVPIARQQFSIPFARILRAPVTMKKQPFRWMS